MLVKLETADHGREVLCIDGTELAAGRLEFDDIAFALEDSRVYFDLFWLVIHWVRSDLIDPGYAAYRRGLRARRRRC